MTRSRFNPCICSKFYHPPHWNKGFLWGVQTFHAETFDRFKYFWIPLSETTFLWSEIIVSRNAKASRPVLNHQWCQFALFWEWKSISVTPFEWNLNKLNSYRVESTRLSLSPVFHSHPSCPPSCSLQEWYGGQNWCFFTPLHYKKRTMKWSQCIHGF